MRFWWGLVVALLLVGCGSTLVGPDPEEGPEELFEVFWESYDRHYAHFLLKDIDWDQVYEQQRPRVGPETTDDELFEIFADMITLLEDGHVYVVGDERRAVSNRHLRAGRSTFDAGVVEKNYLLGTDQEVADGRIVYGQLDEGIGYIRIGTLSGGDGFGRRARGWIEEFDTVMSQLSDASAIVLDLRNNGGGRASNSKYIASYFAEERRKFLVTRSRSGPGHEEFSPPRNWYVTPASQDVFTGPVVLLTNRRTFSAAEWLTLALRQFDHVVHMGTHTGGGLAMFLPRQLSNGWMYTISVQDTRCPQGRSYERVGIAPHRYLDVVEDQLDNGRDPMLDAAVEFLQAGEVVDAHRD